MNPNQALGLPERSVRAVMFLWPMALTSILLIMGRPVPEILWAGFTGGPLLYAGSRRLDGTQTPQQPVDLNAVNLLEQVRGIKP